MFVKYTCTPSLPDKQEGNEGGNKSKPRVNEPRGGIRWKCPGWEGQHLYMNARGENHLSSRLSACEAFESMSPADRSRLVERIVWCRRCTSWMHHADDCVFNRPTSWGIRTASWYCGKDHHKTQHWAGTEYCLAQNNASGFIEGREPTKYECPVCKNHYSYSWQSGPVFRSRGLMDCQEFTDADPAHRRSLLQELGGCRIFTGWMHDTTNCWVGNKRLCGVTTAEGTCNDWHHKSLHVSRLDCWRTEASMESMSDKD